MKFAPVLALPAVKPPSGPGVPTLVLSARTIAENASAGATVGTLSVANGSGSYTFSLTDTAGNRFALDGADLERGATSLDYEAATSHSITVEADNGVDTPLTRTFTILVTDIDDTAPTITSTNSHSVAEGTGYSATATANETVTWAKGGTDAALVTLNTTTGAWSVAAQNYETKTSVEFTLTATDGAGLSSSAQTVTLTITNVNETPTDIALSANTVAEDAAPGTLVGTLSTTDPDAGATFTYTLTDTAGGRFSIASGNQLVTGLTGFDYASATSHNVTVRSTDQGGLYYEEVFAISVTEAGFSLDFTTGSLPGDVDFERASSATYFDSAGVLQTAATDVPRLDYDPDTLEARGLLIEEQRANVLTYSSDFSNAAWTKENVTQTANSATAPDGANTATLITDTGSGEHRFYQNFTGARNCLSIFAKAGTASFVSLSHGSGGYASFNLATGAVAATSSGVGAITPIGSGWHRCSFYPDASIDYLVLKMGRTAAEAVPSGGVTYTAAGNTVYVWGAMAELGPFATSYVPTGASAVTRAADEASFTIPDGITSLRYTFDDDSTQDVSVSSGSYSIPTNLDRPHIKTIVGS